MPGSPVLTDIEMSIASGERVAVVGETGAGKTTIAKLLLRFYDPTAGHGVASTAATCGTSPLRPGLAPISLIPQEGFLFNGTLRDNLRYAKPDADDRQIRAVCIEMGIDDWVDSLPDGLDTEVRERGGRFSAGERQLVALARAFLADPAVIVLDEATSNLDPETEAKVERALNVVLNSRTAVVIAHRLNSAERADRIVMMDGGRIIAKGRHVRSGGGWWAVRPPGRGVVAGGGPRTGLRRALSRREDPRPPAWPTYAPDRDPASRRRCSWPSSAAGKPLASAGIRPPKVICPRAWIGRMAFLTKRTGGMLLLAGRNRRAVRC